MSDDVYDVEGGEGGGGAWGDGDFRDCGEVSLEAGERERPLVVGTSDDAAAARGEGKGTGGPAAHASAFTSAFTNAKAGMEGVDREKVKRIVHEMSKDSSHFHNESRKEQAVEDRIREMRKRWAELCNNNNSGGSSSSSRGGGDQLSAVRQAVGERVAVLEAGRNLTKTWIHVDMDAFFAAVHELERPELRLLPLAVGGMSMISTANYTARKFGVRSAMPAGGSRPFIHTTCTPRAHNVHTT